jgi:hypothetical protein
MNRWMGVLFVVLFLASFARAQVSCKELLQEAGGVAVDEFTDAWEISTKDLLELLQLFYLDEVLSDEVLAPYEGGIQTGVVCTGNLLFVPLNQQSTLLVVDWSRGEKRVEIPLPGLPAEVWTITESVFAMNLFYGPAGLEGAIFNTETAEILLFSDPARFGDNRIKMVVGKHVLFENTSWAGGDSNLSLHLYEVQEVGVHEAARCLVKTPEDFTPRNSFEYALFRYGILMLDPQANNSEDRRFISYILPECIDLSAILLN